MKQYLLLTSVLLFACCGSRNDVVAQTTMNEKLYITIGGQTVAASLVDNAATQALIEHLQGGDVAVTLNSSGGFEIWGALGFLLPASNEQITAQLGYIVLYNGSNICMFYGSNSWSYTRLGHIDELSGSELRTFLHAGESNIAVTLSLRDATTGINDVQASMPDAPAYTIGGQPVTTDYKGIVIQSGKKTIRR